MGGMWKKKENYFLAFGVIQAVGALVAVLQYLGITPSPTKVGGAAMPVVHPSGEYGVLAWATLLFVFSFGFSVFGFYLSNRRRKDLEGQLAQKSAALQAAGIELSSLRSEQRDQLLQAQNAWKLKEGARAIKRKWPNADFLDYPANKDSWLSVRPQITEDPTVDDRTWLDEAIRWYEEFNSSPCIVGSDYGYLKSLGFDELMEYLDFYERSRRGLTVSISAASMDAPAVGITRWGLNPEGNYGAFVKNHRPIPAFDIRLPSFRIGRYRFSFSDAVINEFISR